MTRKLKMLGMAFVAVLALTAVSASAASAANYTASAYPTTGTAESASGNDTFITEAGKVECRSHFEGSLGAASSTLTVNATYDKETCKAFGFLNATVTMGTCDYLFGAPTGSGDSYTAAVQVKCSGAKIKIVASTCEVEIGEQSPTGSVAITNDTTAGDTTVKAGVTGIKYTVTKDGIGCPFSGTGEKTGAEYKQDNAVTFDSTNGATIDVG